MPSIHVRYLPGGIGAVILWWMSISDTLIDILDVPPREVRSDEAQSFATYKNYLLSLSKFILAHYGDEPACFASMHSRCLEDKLETPARNHKLMSGDETAIRKSLFNCWHTELVLRLPTKTPDLIRYANHWSPVQAYYAIYLCLRAYLRSYGDGVADTHATTLKTISFQLEQRKLLLPFWRRTPRSRFKTALQLARTFPFGVLASQACPYCYNTGYSSPGTRSSYCRRRER